MRLLLRHPELPTCADCQKWIYNPKNWQRSERPRGTPVKRELGMLPPCHSCPKIPKGIVPIPANAVELSDKNWSAYMHYLKCRAVNRFPKDAIVERNATLIRMVEEEVARHESVDNVGAVLSLFRRR